MIYFRLIVFAFSVLFLFPKVLSAQNMSEFYVSKNTEQGALYFILPDKLKRLSGDAYKSMSYDFTYLAQSDTVRMLTTFKSESPQIPRSFYFEKDHSYPIEIIRTYRDKRWWVYRLSCHIPYDVWFQVMQADTAPIFHLKLKDGDTLNYAYSKSKWEKRRKAYQLFFQLLKLN